MHTFYVPLPSLLATLLLLDDTQLTHAQVILHGLNSLYEACEREALIMLEHVEEIAVPEEWRSTDLVKQTEEVMVGHVGFIGGEQNELYLYT